MREPMDWADDWRTVVQTVFFIAMVSLCLVWTDWLWYAGTGAVFHFILSILFWTRWKGTENLDRKKYFMSIGWPVTLLLFPKIVWDEEGHRRLRLIRAVMET